MNFVGFKLSKILEDLCDHLAISRTNEIPSEHQMFGILQDFTGSFKIFQDDTMICPTRSLKNYRPTERLAVVQDPSSPGSKSAFDPLDQLYMTILSAAQRQSQLIPILCAIFDFELAVPCHIDQSFGLADGETQLLLRNLNSVIAVPFSAAGKISSHHASFGDFLKNPDRSGDFCVGTLNRRITLARSLLQFYTGPAQRKNFYHLFRLIGFIILLPPSDAVAELFPLIGSINPDHIFDPGEYQSRYRYFRGIVRWLKKTPSVPAALIQLWEDYAFMFSIDTTPDTSSHPLSYPVLNFSAFSITLCALRPKVVGDKHVLPVPQPQAVYAWAARDMALQFSRKMVKNHIDTDGGVNPGACRDTVWMYNAYSYIRNLEEAYTDTQLSDCPLLALHCIASSGLSHLPKYGLLGPASFPDSTMELITFWQQAVPDAQLCRICTFNPDLDVEEREWRDRVELYNDTIVRLNLPDSLKIFL
ncbi:hypothetical protein C8R45DRAFT_1165385 [Mycena sanguinolenta]|nr:hypothetical protein C8R45DRAFT_1165385 [Mycena sanguinolenta]